jgi:hypothetical protein
MNEFKINTGQPQPNRKQDIIDKLQYIILYMETNGYVELSKKLSDTIHYSSTGTELLMKARYYLQSYTRECVAIECEEFYLIKKVIEDINVLLKGE